MMKPTLGFSLQFSMPTCVHEVGAWASAAAASIATNANAAKVEQFLNIRRSSTWVARCFNMRIAAGAAVRRRTAPRPRRPISDRLSFRLASVTRPADRGTHSWSYSWTSPQSWLPENGPTVTPDDAHLHIRRNDMKRFHCSQSTDGHLTPRWPIFASG